jgi:hypothetical protein
VKEELMTIPADLVARKRAEIEHEAKEENVEAMEPKQRKRVPDGCGIRLP